MQNLLNAKTNFFANVNSYSCTRDSADIGASDLHSYPVQDVAEMRVLRSRRVQQHRVLNSHHSSIDR